MRHHLPGWGISIPSSGVIRATPPHPSQEGVDGQAGDYVVTNDLPQARGRYVPSLLTAALIEQFSGTAPGPSAPCHRRATARGIDPSGRVSSLAAALIGYAGLGVW